MIYIFHNPDKLRTILPIIFEEGANSRLSFNFGHNMHLEDDECNYSSFFVTFGH